MRWSTGWYGDSACDRLPAGGRAVPGLDAVWTLGWPSARIRTAAEGWAALAVIGECGADDRELATAPALVRAGKWRALTRWPGSYLTVARSGPTLAVIGDLTGQHPVYWRTDAAGTWWSTSACALATLDGAPVDPLALAAHLSFGQPDVLGERSLFRTVRRVPSGHLLLISPEEAGTVPYEPASYDPVDLHRAGPALRAALFEAVATRIVDRPVSADLAGLDSTTLACLAARSGPVTAVTFADPRLRDDDLVYAARTAVTVPDLHHQVVSGNPDTVYYQGLDDLTELPATDAPSAYTVTAAIKRAVLDTVSARHPAPGVHLTGAAGDALLSAPSSYLADLLREGRHRDAWRHALGHARLRHTSAFTTLRRARPAARTTLPGAWQQIAAELRGPARAWVPQAQRPVSWTPLLATADWMSPDARHHLADALTRAAEELADPPKLLAPWSDRQDLARVGANSNGWREIAQAEYGIELATPYLDNEVVRACLSVPADQRGAPGRYKPLLASAFVGTGVLPGFVLTRITKGGFNALAYEGLRRHTGQLQDLLGTTSRLAALGLVTEAPVHEMLKRAAAGQPTAQGALHLMTSAEIWLRQLDTAPAPAWRKVNSHVAPA
ncbi:albusnodin/ikarugamycin family macrolactam cyclase [Streptomyces yaizuensis]|uniref:asparagine synthase (glutamine-hydrolyzing) n=1 Tax=Streptomyces yaizuensis TaxID=2989713 RepID=A0ABQ5P5C7_9ACTN|nr:albusnodin/ikarugamycin family macrolactam cyclase [Streptomyces sp. YSPA8]GLF97801.1 albusnodin/ikarugamycin family macrolactam cyclase [Streptomyces sp. YSPA8]